MDTILVPDRKLTFTIDKAAAFRDTLSEDAETLVLAPVTTKTDVMLDQKYARVGGRYRMTSTGATQFLSSVANGLYQVIRGVNEKIGTQLNPESAAKLAAMVVNPLAAVAYSELDGMKLVVCNKRNELDGFVSASYASVSNEKIYGLFNDACEMLTYRPSFLLGELDGRNMTAVLISREACRGVAGTYLGVMCQNGETAGRAVRSSVVLLDSLSRSWSVAPFDRELRVPHKRRWMRDRMMAMGDTLSVRHRQILEVLPKLQAARTRRVAKSWNQQEGDKFRQGLKRQLDSGDFISSQLDVVVDHLLAKGTTPPSWFDCYAECLKVADTLPVSWSIPLRQFAFRMTFES